MNKMKITHLSETLIEIVWNRLLRIKIESLHPIQTTMMMAMMSH